MTNFLAFMILWLDFLFTWYFFLEFSHLILCFSVGIGKWIFSESSLRMSCAEESSDGHLSLYYLLSNSIKLWLTLIGELLTKLLLDAGIRQLFQINIMIETSYINYSSAESVRWWRLLKTTHSLVEFLLESRQLFWEMEVIKS